jgi:hypothetical protein
LNWAKANNPVRRRELVDDFPEQLHVLPAELKVIETYLAGLLDDESFEPGTGETKHDSQTGMWNRANLAK